jgi:hypothetical protein
VYVPGATARALAGRQPRAAADADLAAGEPLGLGGPELVGTRVAVVSRAAPSAVRIRAAPAGKRRRRQVRRGRLRWSRPGRDGVAAVNVRRRSPISPLGADEIERLRPVAPN